MNAIIIADVITMVVFAVGIVIYTDRAINAIKNSQLTMHSKMDDSITRCADFHIESKSEQKDLLKMFIDFRREDQAEHKEIVAALQQVRSTLETFDRVLDIFIQKETS